MIRKRLTPRQRREVKRVLARSLPADEWIARNTPSAECADGYRRIRAMLEQAAATGYIAAAHEGAP